MKLLYLCHRIPYPPNKGDKIRTYHQIRYLAQRCQVDLAALADDPQDLVYAKKLAAICRRTCILPLNRKTALLRGGISLLRGRSISQGYFFHPGLLSIIRQWMKDTAYDAVLCFSSVMASYVISLGKKPDGPVAVMDFCDLDSDKWQQYSTSASFPMNLIYRREAETLFRFERQVDRCFTHSVFISEKEADLFKEKCPDSSPKVVGNGVDCRYFDPAGSIPHDPAGRPMLLFSGAMDYHANGEGVAWFAREIFPLIREEMPEASFYIVGSNPTPGVRALEDIAGVWVTGFVTDIRPYYRAADLCVVPLRIARGVQNKVLEAMAMARPVLATGQSLQGISPEIGSDLLKADNAVDFAASAIAVLKDKERADSLGRAARSYVISRHDWDKNLKDLFELICGTTPGEGM